MFGLKFNSGTSKVLLAVTCFVLASIVACTGVANAQTRTSYVHLADRATTTGTSLASVTTLFSDSAGNATLHRVGAGYLRFVVPASGEAVGLTDTDIGSTVQGYDADTAKLDVAQTWTANQEFGAVKASYLDCPVLTAETSTDVIRLKHSAIESWPTGSTNDIALRVGDVGFVDGNGDAILSLTGAGASTLDFSVGDLEAASTGYKIGVTAASGTAVTGPLGVSTKATCGSLQVDGPVAFTDGNVTVDDHDGETVFVIDGVAGSNLNITFGDINVASTGYKIGVTAASGAVVTGPCVVNDADGNALVSVTGTANGEDIVIKFGDVDEVSASPFIFDSGNGEIHLPGELFTDNDRYLKGTRMMLQAGRAASTSASVYLTADGVQQSATIGWVMPSAGSITGVSIGGNVTSNSGGSAKIEVMKNGASVFTSDTFASSGTGWKSAQKTQSRGTDTFAAGDVLALKFTYGGGGIAIENMLATLVVVLD